MHGFATIFQLTLAEARRRKLLLAALLCGLAFLGLFGLGFYFIHRDVTQHALVAAVKKQMILTTFALAGLFAVNFLTVMTAVLMPVDTLSGEIASGVMQTLASKPVRRSTIVLGKWAAHGVVLAGYLLFMAGGVLAVARGIAHVTPPGIAPGLALILLEGLVLMTLSIAGGTRLSTITNGITVLGLYGLAFVGSWTEQLGALAGNETARHLGTLTSLLVPSEAMWQLAAWHMQPSVVRDLHLTPFSPVSVPNGAMVVWAVGYVLLTLAVAVRSLSRRPL
ncbi:MAG TPA: ABC transporter permease [Candidatus Saccharimonadales bacterium]|nr:ABC transporter permease [Candidatus Saccharimonadales bacterium]